MPYEYKDVQLTWLCLSDHVPSQKRSPTTSQNKCLYLSSFMPDVTLYSNRGLAVLSFQYCPRFNCKVIALKSWSFVVKSRTKFTMKCGRDLNAKDTSVGDGGRVRPSALCPRFEYKDALKSAI